MSGNFEPLGPRTPPRTDTSGVPVALPAPGYAAANGVYTVRNFNPWAQVRLFSRSTGQDYDFAISGSVSGDMLSLDTNKTLSDPAGTWSITLNPRRFAQGGRNVTWADIFSRNDYCEITMGLWHDAPGVVVMRGFVDHCHKLDSADPQRGLPARRVLVSGRDFGKLWLDFKVFYLAEAGQTAGNQNTNLIQINWGILPGMKTPNSFLADIYAKLLLPRIARRQQLNPHLPSPTVVCEVPDIFQIDTRQQNFIAYSGSLWNIMEMFRSPPFTEFLIRDVPGADAPEIRWRWAPLTRLGNRLALPWTAHPPVRTLHADELSRYDVDASDNERYTYFWAPPGQYGANITGLVTGKYLAPGYIDGEGIDLWYDYKPLEPAFNMYRINTSDDPADDDPKKSEPIWTSQIKQNVQWLADVMLPNDIFLSGPLQTHLRPDIAIGEYLDVPEEGTRFYVEGVSHSLVFSGKPQVSTMLRVTRGQRLDGKDTRTPDSYKYTDGAPIPGGSLTGHATTRAEAEAADGAAKAPNQAGGNPSTAPAPPFVGGPEVAKVLSLALSLEGRADYNLGKRNYNKATLGEALAAILRPVGQGGGIDCSELIAFAFKFGAGINISPPADAQYRQTPRVAYADLRQGDILFFGGTTGGDISGANITHSGLYLGNGEMINAQDFGQKVVRADITGGYWKEHFVSGGRVFTVNAGAPAQFP